MTAPRRIQLRRTKGWRLRDISPYAVVVARPTRWGNPFAALVPHGEAALVDTASRGALVEMYRSWLVDHRSVDVVAAAWSAQNHRGVLLHPPRLGVVRRPDVREVRTELAGLDLACWCPLDQPCHADVLLDIANGGTS